MEDPTLCACGCGDLPGFGNRFVHGHNRRRLTVDSFVIEKRSLVVETPCHVWLGALDPDGYGHLRVGRKKPYAHVVAWEAIYGPVPSGFQLHHVCEVRACIWDEHLELMRPLDHQRYHKIGNKNALDHAVPIESRRRQRLKVARLTPEEVEQIRTDPRTQRVIAADFGITQSHVCNIKKGRSWFEWPS